MMLVNSGLAFVWGRVRVFVTDGERERRRLCAFEFAGELSLTGNGIEPIMDGRDSRIG